MIKREVLLRSQIRTIYSSEKQERMKVYFELTEQYNMCLQPCKLQPVEQKQTCIKECEKIYDKYAQILKQRYEKNPQNLTKQVKNLPIFTTRSRPDRTGWFYNIAGMSFWQAMGYPPQTKIS